MGRKRQLRKQILASALGFEHFPCYWLSQTRNLCTHFDLCPLLEVLDSVFTESTAVSMAPWAGFADMARTQPVSSPPLKVYRDFLSWYPLLLSSVRGILKMPPPPQPLLQLHT